MTIKHIRWVACIGLLAIICLQYVWLVNTYKLTKESIQFRSNEVFRDATMREVFYRMEVYQDSLQKKYKDKDTSIMVRINLDEDYDFFEDGRGDKNVNQWLMSNMQVSMQEIVKRDYKLSVSLSSLDSIYRTGLAAEGLDAEVITCVTLIHFDMQSLRIFQADLHRVHKRNFTGIDKFIFQEYIQGIPGILIV